MAPTNGTLRITNIKKNKDYLVLLSHINEFYELAKYQERSK